MQTKSRKRNLVQEQCEGKFEPYRDCAAAVSPAPTGDGESEAQAPNAFSQEISPADHHMTLLKDVSCSASAELSYWTPIYGSQTNRNPRGPGRHVARDHE